MGPTNHREEPTVVTQPSIEQIQALIESLDSSPLDTNERVHTLQEIRRMSASLYLNCPPQDATEECYRIDALVLKACGIALTSQEA